MKVVILHVPEQADIKPMDTKFCYSAECIFIIKCWLHNCATWHTIHLNSQLSTKFVYLISVAAIGCMPKPEICFLERYDGSLSDG